MNFFRISHDETDPHYDRRLAEWVPGDVELESVVCPIDEGHQRAGKRLSNLSIILPNRSLQEFVWTWYSECLVREHVLNVFRAHRLTGYDLKPVKAVFKQFTDRQPPRLWELDTTSRVRAAASAGLYVRKHCDACGYIRYSAYENGLPVDESTWNGSDFFRFQEWGGLFVTERVRDCVLQHKLTGVSIVRVEDLRWPEGVVKP